MLKVERHRCLRLHSAVFFCLRYMETLEEFKKLFANADEMKIRILSGLIEEAYDCKVEIGELKALIRDMKARNAKFSSVSKREKLLIQKRASYTNMMSKLCRELCAVDSDGLDDEGLEDYE